MRRTAFTLAVMVALGTAGAAAYGQDKKVEVTPTFAISEPAPYVEGQTVTFVATTRALGPHEYLHVALWCNHTDGSYAYQDLWYIDEPWLLRFSDATCDADLYIDRYQHGAVTEREVVAELTFEVVG